ncbi:unnamed protein product [Mycena citricolor]|uniref:Ribosome biogenesis protein NOP53 n=1 Tax=Mycena citricolor TaxID=2018698 RepID=A0AAD2K1K4_9AGAR|nr:unnamed protein product [Mycena citricolor]
MRAAEAEVVEGMPTGMKLDEVVSDEDNDEGDVVSELLPKKAPERKTKAQRNKATKLLAEKRARIDLARRKAEHAMAHNSRQLRRAAEETASIREKARALKRSQLQERLKQGLGGQKLGKHKVPEGEIDVQLGEDLSESLRGLKVRRSIHSCILMPTLHPRSLRATCSAIASLVCNNEHSSNPACQSYRKGARIVQ